MGHSNHTKVPRTSRLAKALYAAEVEEGARELGVDLWQHHVPIVLKSMQSIAAGSMAMTVVKNLHQQIIVAALGLPVSPDRQKVLLTQRHAPDNPIWHHKWQIASGSLDFGEELEEAVAREMWEELHVKDKIIHPHPIVKSNVWYADESDEKMDTHVVLITYLVDIRDQTPDLSHDPDWETSACGCYSLAKVRTLDLLPLTLPLIEEAFHLIANHAII